MSRPIKFEIMFLVSTKEFKKKIAKHYTTLDRLIDGSDSFDYSAVDIIARRQSTGLTDVNGVEIYEGDVVDLGQTVNGCSKFIIKLGDFGVEAEYAEVMTAPRNYEYCIKEFFAIDNNTGEGLFVIGNTHEITP